MKFRRLISRPCGMVAALGLAVVIFASGLFAEPNRQRAPRSHHTLILQRQQSQSVYLSYNWSGYAVTGVNGSVTHVKGSWIVPPANCALAHDGAAAFWVGIDGFTSNTVEQIGTDSDCENLLGTAGNTPTYYAWFEFYPDFAYLVGNYTNDGVCESDCVYPGDFMSAEVTAGAGKKFTISIHDLTRNWSFTTSATVPGAAHSSAQWIAETPFGCPTDSGFCQLTDFGIVDYGIDFTGAPNSNYATVNGNYSPLGGFGNDVQQLIMVNYPSGTTLMAVPSPLSGDLTSFAVGWLNPGP